ncbi:DNA-directed RNA polymerase III subunit RPC3-like [Styela clava]
MAQAECDLCNLLLKKYFGSIVSNVGKFLCKNGRQPLGQIIISTKLKPSLVKKSLCVLIQHKLVRFFKKKKRIEYIFDMKIGLRLLQIPKIIYTTKLLYGDPGELIIEEILVNGISTMESTLETVVKRLQESTEKVNENEVKTIFENLTNARFLLVEPNVEDTGDVDAAESRDSDSQFPAGNRKRKYSGSENDAPQKKRTKNAFGTCYSINYARYSQYFRDQSIIAGVTQKFNVACGEIVRTLLRISEVTTSGDAEVTQPISSNEIKHALPSNMNLSVEYIEQYLNIMKNDEGNFVQKSDETSSGTYAVNIKKCITAICHANVLSYVQERFGSKCCRIFKLLMLKNHMEQKQVEDFAMIPSKEAKELLYQMWAENLLVMQEIPKTADHAPSRTYYLFNVNIKKVVRTLLSRLNKMLVNLLARQQYEVKGNKRLLEKRKRIDSIKANLQQAEEDQLEEIEEMLTPAERDHLQKLEHCCNKLGKSQIQAENTAFLYNSFLGS